MGEEEEKRNGHKHLHKRHAKAKKEEEGLTRAPSPPTQHTPHTAQETPEQVHATGMFSSMLKFMGGGGKEAKPKVVPCCRSGSDAQQGRRMTMEDTHVHFDDISEKYGFPKDVTRAFYAVYDGHGGRRAAEAAEVSHKTSVFPFSLFRCCSQTLVETEIPPRVPPQERRTEEEPHGR